eukprot:TRINITY_DN27688_c0_g3_i1.p1 TRINITY_DN27688_c0_g3~~TRINITY_DN27688_c0_g3_i1.p1  ORF type:complete len:598 (+),score=80.78 TRINITY_DN27688_c0_g3_i1:128-1921(+)
MTTPSQFEVSAQNSEALDRMTSTTSGMSSKQSIGPIPSQNSFVYTLADSSKITALQLASNMTLSIVGTTVLGITAQMKRGGWIVSPLLLIIGCFIIVEMTSVVSMTMDKLQANGHTMTAYQDFIGAALGPAARRISAVTSTFALVGMICNGFILESQNLQFVAPLRLPWLYGNEAPCVGAPCGWKDAHGNTCEQYATAGWCTSTGDFGSSWDATLNGTFGDHSSIVGISAEQACCQCGGGALDTENKEQELGQKWWALILSFTTLLYVFADLGELLKRTAAVGPFVCAACVLLAWTGAGMAIAGLQEFPASCFDETTVPFWRTWPGDAMAIPGIAAYAFYCFAVVVTVPSLKGQMQEPAKLVGAASAGYILCTVLFLLIMTMGYWGFGGLGPDNLIQGMRQNRPPGWWAMSRPWETGEPTAAGQCFAWMIILNLLLTDGIYVPCAMIAVERAVLGDNAEPVPWNQMGPARIGARVGLTLLRFLVATEVKSFVELTNLTSALFCVCNNVLLPILAFHCLFAHDPRIGPRKKALHAAIFAFGLMVAFMGSYTSIKNMVSAGGEGCADAAPIGHLPRRGISDVCYQEALSVRAAAGKSER